MNRLFFFFKASRQDGRSVSMWRVQPANQQAWPPAEPAQPSVTRGCGVSSPQKRVVAVEWRQFSQQYEGFYRLEPLISNQRANTRCLLLQSVTWSSAKPKPVLHIKACGLNTPMWAGLHALAQPSDASTSCIFSRKPRTLTCWMKVFPPLCLWLPWNVTRIFIFRCLRRNRTSTVVRVNEEFQRMQRAGRLAQLLHVWPHLKGHTALQRSLPCLQQRPCRLTYSSGVCFITEITVSQSCIVFWKCSHTVADSVNYCTCCVRT